MHACDHPHAHILTHTNTHIHTNMQIHTYKWFSCLSVSVCVCMCIYVQKLSIPLGICKEAKPVEQTIYSRMIFFVFKSYLYFLKELHSSAEPQG